MINFNNLKNLIILMQERDVFIYIKLKIFKLHAERNPNTGDI